MANPQASTITANISVILLVLGVIFIFAKVLSKGTNNADNKSLYDKLKVPLYNFHKSGTALATILGFVHGSLVEPISRAYVITGWTLGGSMLLMSVLGIYMGFKSDWVPYNESENKKFKTLRIVKWVLTLVMIGALPAHYLITG